LQGNQFSQNDLDLRFAKIPRCLGFEFFNTISRTTDIVRPTRHVGKVPGTDIQARFEGAPNPGIYNGTVMPGMGH